MIEDIREDVRKKYAQAIANRLSCCGTGATNNPVTGNLYETNEIQGLPEDILMVGKEYTIRIAREADLVMIHKMLTENGLTTEGVEGNLDNFFVADHQGTFGVIGLEFSNDEVLLRSLAICEHMRKRGIGSALVEYSLNMARAEGKKGAYLLTNTADKFASRWGFSKIERYEIPESLIQSSTLNNFCPDSSICMKLDFSNVRSNT